MAGFRIEGNTSGNVAEVNSSNEVKVTLGLNDATMGGVRNFSENDDGTYTGVPYLLSPETNDDYELRTTLETSLDTETFNYTAQNTGKHTFLNTTMTAAWNLGSFQTNSGSITTLSTGLAFGTYAFFPLNNSTHLYAEFAAAFSAQPVTNTTIDFGLFQRAITAPYAPTDGAYFRLSAAGLQGVTNYNGSETATSVFTFAYTNSQKYHFIIIITEYSVEFWINNVLYAEIQTPVGNGQPFASQSIPISVRHSIGAGAASGAMSFLLSNYSVSLGGITCSDSLGTIGNRMLGSYQGLSGGTMGSLTTYTNSTNATAAVPSNTALTANLPNGLGGQAWETFTLAVNTDAILLSYQVPAGTVSIQGKRLKVSAVKLSSFVQTVLAGGPLVRVFSLSFGGSTVTLAGTEAASTKNRRIVLLPELTQVVTAAQAVSTFVAQPGSSISTFIEPIYVNPGEFIQVCVKHVGTVGTSGTIATNIQLVYSWE